MLEALMQLAQEILLLGVGDRLHISSVIYCFHNIRSVLYVHYVVFCFCFVKFTANKDLSYTMTIPDSHRSSSDSLQSRTTFQSAQKTSEPSRHTKTLIKQVT